MKRFMENHTGKTYDLAIIGGGITGAAVAYDAASRGLSVALVEKGDFGAATSSATSKLIHGGLRYLATMEFSLVRESLRERKTLENIAPNFVYPIAFMVTTNNAKITNTRPVIKAGMIMYDIFSWDKQLTWDKSKRIPLHRSITPAEVLRLEPNVKREGLTGASIYYDCVSIFPERLTLAFIKSAVKYGADVSNYAKVTDFIKDAQGRIAGIKVHDLVTGAEKEINAALTINCGGPWADIILGIAKKERPAEQLRRSEGIHVITRKLINDHVVGSITASGRHFFLIPWRGHSLIGTTDKEYIGSPDEYRVTKQSILELLHDVNSAFGNGDPITYDDVLYSYGGLRPLVEDQTEDVYESSRKYEIYDNADDGLDGLITVEGGKYTTSRNLAENVMNVVIKKLKKKTGGMITAKEFLAGCEIPDMNAYLKNAVGKNSDFPESTVDYLARIYGTELEKVLSLARTNKEWARPLDRDGEMPAQVVYAVRSEMALTLKDIIFRRTGLGTLGNPGGDVLRVAAETAAAELGWDSARTASEIESAEKALRVPQD
ncbi:MAG TPA: glycerol-3-phosphate dehydrogenase/oxidase [Spirochaetota bacterium]|nr:glycerol-3-phosphate dehydrogenase/oxidase [Spirochaetota bacterium]HPI91175.1 glycerol-3-phosphate dehydrogenase/oxidase [Spirochaetota bacterium]HPR47187.1 glycerol-3-phosphate dehydrogenase/oxidase [Spirochaetota bacterium]